MRKRQRKKNAKNGATRFILTAGGDGIAHVRIIAGPFSQRSRVRRERVTYQRFFPITLADGTVV
jgi:hypothetical protein